MAVRVQTQDFDVAAETAKLIGGRTDVGAVVTFTGRVRGTDDDRQIAGLTLEHYPDMTEAELARIEAEAQARWPLQASRPCFTPLRPVSSRRLPPRRRLR